MRLVLKRGIIWAIFELKANAVVSIFLKGCHLMIPNTVLALIAAKPGRLRDSLRALLTAIPQIDVVNQVDEGPLALKMVTQFHPTLVLLDSNLPSSEIQSTLKRIKGELPQPRCIVLVDNDQQQCDANNSGADAVLVKGFSVANLFGTVEKLLSVPGG